MKCSRNILTRKNDQSADLAQEWDDKNSRNNKKDHGEAAIDVTFCCSHNE